MSRLRKEKEWEREGEGERNKKYALVDYSNEVVGSGFIFRYTIVSRLHLYGT